MRQFSIVCNMLLGVAGFVYILLISACNNDGTSDQSSVTQVALIPEEEVVARPLPSDALSPERQVYRYFSGEPSSLDVSVALYESLGSAFLFE